MVRLCVNYLCVKLNENLTHMCVTVSMDKTRYLFVALIISGIYRYFAQIRVDTSICH